MVIAYLAPELPARSATFVYEEILGLERRGIRIVPVSVRRPADPAEDQAALASRTEILYAGTAKTVLEGLRGLRPSGGRLRRALRWLVSDMRACGLHRSAAWKLAFQFLAAVRLARILRQGRCDHLHVHFAHTPAQIGMYAAALAGIPFTVTAHANDLFERGLLLRRKAERAARLLTISEYNRGYLEQQGIPRERLAVVRCGVSFAVKEGRGARGPQRAPLRLGTLGRLVEKKGVDVLLRAVAQLREAGGAVELSIAGDGPERATLEALARSLGLADLVRFLGSLAHRDVAAWMAGLDAFVLACRPDSRGDMDGIPVVLMEAMSQSVPVVSTRLSGIPELVVDGRTGLLARPGDAGDLAAQIARLAASPALGEALAARGRAHVAAEFGQAPNLERLVAQFEAASAARA